MWAFKVVENWDTICIILWTGKAAHRTCLRAGRSQAMAKGWGKYVQSHEEILPQNWLKALGMSCAVPPKPHLPYNFHFTAYTLSS